MLEDRIISSLSLPFLPSALVFSTQCSLHYFDIVSNSFRPVTRKTEYASPVIQGYLKKKKGQLLLRIFQEKECLCGKRQEFIV